MLNKSFYHVLMNGIIIGILFGALSLIVISGISGKVLDVRSSWEWYVLCSIIMIAFIRYFYVRIDDFIQDFIERDSSVQSAINERLRKPVQIDER